MNPGQHGGQNVVSALDGNQAIREREVAFRTRRVVLASLGVMQDQKAGRRQVRAVALAAIVLVLFLLGPLLWWAVENLKAEGHFGALSCQFAFWICFLCPALVAAALVAGWVRNRS